MTIHIHVDTMKDAERLSHICKEYENEVYLKSDKFCVDPKSTLGILAMMYSARDNMYLDTGVRRRGSQPLQDVRGRGRL